MNPVGFKLMFMLCLMMQAVFGEQKIMCIQREREALLKFKASLVDRYSMLSSWTTADCCQWKGIRCSNLTRHVLMLDLHGESSYELAFRFYIEFESQHYISGEIHKSLMELQQLKYLNLSLNYFLDNNIPEFLGSLRNLSYLDLSSCGFRGKIPTQFGSLSRLKYLNLADNYLEGSIPPQLGNLSNLQYLDLSYNNIEGNIPSQLGNLSNLQELYLRYERGLKLGDEGGLKLEDGNQWLSNLISVTHLYLGYISNFSSSHSWLQMIAKLPKLRELSLVHCGLSDPFILSLSPSKFNSSSSLSILDLSSNTFTSSMIFQWVSNITSNLVELDLSRNHLEGSNHIGMSMNSLEHLDLSFNRLKGDLKSFMNICTLHSLYMHENPSNANISGVVPEWFWAKLASRDWMSMNISYNNLQGIIPNFPQKNPYRSLTFASNKFEGPISPFLRGSTSLDLSKNRFSDSLSFLCAGGATETLHLLDLSNNQLSGQIPDCWSHFKSLVFLDLSHNKLSGKIPTSMGSLLDLQALLLRDNNLTDEIPFTLRSCTKLVMLDMAENRLLGPIPSWIGIQMQELEFLSLGSNHLYGNFPLQICYLRSIHLLDLSLNNLSGKIPACIKNFTLMAQKTPSLEYHWYFVNTKVEYGNKPYHLNAFLMWKGKEQMFKNNRVSLLKSIDLSSNHFSEEIPTEIEYLFGLVSLNLSRNNLNGKIPSNIGKLTSLEFIDLSRNQLVGSIPQSLTQIDRLTMLDLSHNQLTGKIPTGTQLQSFNASNYEDNLNLCGPPLEKSCVDGKPTQEAKDEDEYSLLGREFYISMALGFVLSFWVVFGSILFKRSWRHSYFIFLNNLWESIYVTLAVKLTRVLDMVVG